MSDVIGNMLTAIRNGYLARLKTVTVPHSKMKLELGKLLMKEGYLTECTETTEMGLKKIRLVLRYVEKLPAVSHISRVSKPGLRRYVGYQDLKSIMGGKGVSIVSTPQGLVTNRDARKLKAGGEIICKVW